MATIIAIKRGLRPTAPYGVLRYRRAALSRFPPSSPPFPIPSGGVAVRLRRSPLSDASETQPPPPALMSADIFTFSFTDEPRLGADEVVASVASRKACRPELPAGRGGPGGACRGPRQGFAGFAGFQGSASTGRPRAAAGDVRISRQFIPRSNSSPPTPSGATQPPLPALQGPPVPRLEGNKKRKEGAGGHPGGDHSSVAIAWP